MGVVDQITAALISLLIGTLLGSELTRFLYRPRVFIRYRDISPLHAPDGVHWTIKVANIGRTVASDCKGVIFLEDLAPENIVNTSEADAKEILPDYKDENLDLSYPRTQQVQREFFRPIRGEQVAWASLGNPQSIDISPGITEQLDICKFQLCEKGNYIIFPSEHGWRRLRTRIKANSLSGKIMICPSNEFPTVIHFRLAVDGKGNSSFVPIAPNLFQRFARIFFRKRYYFG